MTSASLHGLLVTLRTKTGVASFMASLKQRMACFLPSMMKSPACKQAGPRLSGPVTAEEQRQEAREHVWSAILVPPSACTARS